MTGIVLHDDPRSPYCQKNKIALREKGVEFSRVLQDTARHEANGALTALNPRAEVPVLCRGEIAIFDSSIIQEYIEECWPRPSLLPDTPAERARARMIEDVMDTQYEAVIWGMSEVRLFRSASGGNGDALSTRAREQLRGLHNWLSRELGGSDWFNGQTFGWADVAVVPFVASAAAQQAGPSPRSALAQWLRRALARPSVAATVAEAEAADNQAQRPVASRNGTRREYRDHRLEWMIRSGGLEVVHRGIAGQSIRFSRELC